MADHRPEQLLLRAVFLQVWRCGGTSVIGVSMAPLSADDLEKQEGALRSGILQSGPAP